MAISITKHTADCRPMTDDDIMGAIRGLQMTTKSPAWLRAKIADHARINMFASAVIVVAAARRLWLTGHMDLTKMTALELAAIWRDPALVTKCMVDAEMRDRDRAENLLTVEVIAERDR